MDYKVHDELKTLSANLKRFDLDNFFMKREFEIELEEAILDELWELAKVTRKNNSRISFPDYYSYTETFIVGLDLILRQFYNGKINFEKTSKLFTKFLKTCLSFYIKNVNTKKDYSKILTVLDQNDFMDKNILNEIKKEIIERENKIELENKLVGLLDNAKKIASKNKPQKYQDKIKKYQIFISSTFIDLKEERQAAVEAILKKGHIPAGMELFTAGDKSQWEVIKKWIDDSDIYLLILGGRYGSIDESTGLSYTEMEYNYAIDKGKPFFALSLTDEILDKKPIEIIKDFDLKNPKYIAFKEKITRKMCAFPKNNDQIKNEINHSLDTLISENKEKMQGWIKGII